MMPETHWETLEYFKELGFGSTPNRRVKHIEEAEEYYKTWTENAKPCPMKPTALSSRRI